MITLSYKGSDYMKKKQNIPILIQNKNLNNRNIFAEDRVVDYEVKLHWHDYIELELVTGGKAKHIFNGNDAPLEEGTFVFSTFTDYHYIMPKNKLNVLNLNFSLDAVSDELRKRLEARTSGICTKLDKKTYETLKALMQILIAEANEENGSMSYISNIIECIFIKLFETVLQGSENNISSALQSAIIYARSNFINNPSVEDVAKMFNYHPKYFGSVFRKTTGLAFTDYLSKLKVGYAQLLLSTTDRSIEQVCFDCGFSSLATFRRVFKEYCGMSPREYRIRKRNTLDKLPNIGWNYKTNK